MGLRRRHDLPRQRTLRTYAYAYDNRQQIYYAEFDGQRRKRLIVKVMGE